MCSSSVQNMAEKNNHGGYENPDPSENESRLQVEVLFSLYQNLDRTDSQLLLMEQLFQ